ncbi:MAG: alanine racemase [Acidimicrobiales bacterium]
MSSPSTIHDLPTPALVVEKSVFDHNVAAMAAALPGDRLRPHVKAFKSTRLAEQLVAAGHRNFCAATVREIEGMAQAGLGHDLLLANETYDYSRLGPLVEAGADITVAVDSDTVLDAAIAGGVRRVLIDTSRSGCRGAAAPSTTPVDSPTVHARRVSMCAASWATRAI